MGYFPLFLRYKYLFLILLFIYTASHIQTRLLFPENYHHSSGKINFTSKLTKTTLRSCSNFCDLIKPLSLVNGSGKIKESTESYLYLTFDDAPNSGTEHVLDALKEAGVKATFFVIGFKLVKPKDPSMLLDYQKVIMRMIEEGHLLGDHSYDHMLHNIESKPSKTYAGVSDILWFGEKNIDAVTAVMRANGFTEEKVVNVINTMWNYVRLPYTNNWRVGTIRISKGVPNTVKLADALRDDGSLVFGWDIEWGIDWSITRFPYGGEQMFRRLNKNSRTETKGKTVMISHDSAHRPGGNLDAEKELVKFLRLAKQNGYKFRTVDTYMTD